MTGTVVPSQSGCLASVICWLLPSLSTTSGSFWWQRTRQARPGQATLWSTEASHSLSTHWGREALVPFGLAPVVSESSDKGPPWAGPEASPAHVRPSSCLVTAFRVCHPTSGLLPRATHALRHRGSEINCFWVGFFHRPGMSNLETPVSVSELSNLVPPCKQTDLQRRKQKS